MKIISKDQIEERKSPPEYNLKLDKNTRVNLVTSESAQASKSTTDLGDTLSAVKGVRVNHQASRKAQALHEDRERRRRQKEKRRAKLEAKQVPQKRTVPNTSPRNDQNQGPEVRSYIGQRFEQVASLIRFNITFKLTLGYALRFIMVLVLVITAAYASFSYYLFYESQTRLPNDIAYIQGLLDHDLTLDDPLISDYLVQNALYLHFYDSKSLAMVQTTSLDQALAYETIEFPGTFDLTNFPKMHNLFVENRVDFNGAPVILVVEKDMTPATSIIEMTLPIVIVMSIVLLLTSVRAASKMANKQLKPIHTMTEQVQDMSMASRLNISGTKDELKDLAQTFNTMLDDIQKSYEREQQFVSDASHELRTPIAVIKGYANMLNRWGKDDPEVLNESIEAIIGETENMHSLVESLLFIARNDKGTLEMDMSRFDLTLLMHEIIKETRLIDSHHQLRTSISDTCPQYGSVDKLKQALRILIDNSIKYTPDRGDIEISLDLKPPYNVITLKDSGIGISKEDLPHIFDRFYRADKSRTKMKDNQHGGTGLGLSIAKIIIEQHGGKIIVDSDLNIGTTFTVLLPCKNEQSMN